jgi:hypothetical protein
MDTRPAGGVLLAFCGVVLLIAGFRGTLGKVKDALLGGTASAPAPAATGTPAPTGGTSALIQGDPASINSPTLVGQLSPAQLAAFVGIDPPAGYAGTGNQAVHPFHVAPIVV